MAEHWDHSILSQTNSEQHPNVLNAVNHYRIVSNEDRWRKIDFAYAFLPIYYFSRMFGLMPFTLNYNSRGEIQAPQVRRFDAIWFGVSISIYLMAAVTNFLSVALPKEMTTISFALYFGHNVLFIQSLLVGAISIGLDLFNRYKLVAILKAFIAFDKEVIGAELLIRNNFPYSLAFQYFVDGECGISFRLPKAIQSVIALFGWHGQCVLAVYMDNIFLHRIYSEKFFNNRPVALFGLIPT